MLRHRLGRKHGEPKATVASERIRGAVDRFITEATCSTRDLGGNAGTAVRLGLVWEAATSLLRLLRPGVHPATSQCTQPSASKRLRTVAHDAYDIERLEARDYRVGLGQVVAKHRHLGPSPKGRPVRQRERDALIVVEDRYLNMRLVTQRTVLPYATFRSSGGLASNTPHGHSRGPAIAGVLPHNATIDGESDRELGSAAARL